MVVSYEIGSAPVVYLSANVAEGEEQDAVVVEGQEDVMAETESVATDDAEKSDGVTIEDTSAEEEAEASEGEEAATEEEAGASEGEEVATEEEAGVSEGEDAVTGMEGEMTGEDMGADGMSEEGMTEETQAAKDPLLSSPVAIGSISLAVILVGCVIGFILAKRRIKKGIEIYEDF